MWYAAEEGDQRRRQPEPSPREQGYRRQIDCTPRSDAVGPPPPRTSRGRGWCDPERWPRERPERDRRG